MLGTRPDDYVENTQQPLGALALTCRHLQILGYTVILVSTSHDLGSILEVPAARDLRPMCDVLVYLVQWIRLRHFFVVENYEQTNTYCFRCVFLRADPDEVCERVGHQIRAEAALALPGRVSASERGDRGRPGRQAGPGQKIHVAEISGALARHNLPRACMMMRSALESHASHEQNSQDGKEKRNGHRTRCHFCNGSGAVLLLIRRSTHCLF